MGGESEDPLHPKRPKPVPGPPPRDIYDALPVIDNTAEAAAIGE
jgi:hypothetical protein